MANQISTVGLGYLAHFSGVYDGSYQAKLNDPHFGATEPLEAERCRCERPCKVRDGPEVRCFWCGKGI